MIRTCDPSEFEEIYEIINDAAQAYRGVIPADRWKDPYMPREELRHEIHEGVVFWGYEEEGRLLGVMGLQQVQEVTLIRHSYVRTARWKLPSSCPIPNGLRPSRKGEQEFKHDP